MNNEMRNKSANEIKESPWLDSRGRGGRGLRSLFMRGLKIFALHSYTSTSEKMV